MSFGDGPRSLGLADEDSDKGHAPAAEKELTVEEEDPFDAARAAAGLLDPRAATGNGGVPPSVLKRRAVHVIEMEEYQGPTFGRRRRRSDF